MSFDNEAIFTKENLDGYLKELAKAFRKRNGTSMPAEIILVGGAAILVNYGFRAMTTDVDAIIHAASSPSFASSCGITGTPGFAAGASSAIFFLMSTRFSGGEMKGA